MAAPSVLDYGGAARTNSTVVGALAASFACVALWEATRPLRWMNFALGLWLFVAGPVLGLGFGNAASVNGGIVGVLMAAAAARAGGEVKGRYGGGWAALWRSESEGERGANKV